MKLILPYPPSSNRYWRYWRGHVVKAIEDALNKVAYNDDRQIRRCTWELDFDQLNPRAVVSVQAMEKK